MSPERTSHERAPLSAILAHRALDAAVTGVVIVDMTRAGQEITYVNPAFERITGYLSAEAVGRNCRFLQGLDTDPAAIRSMSTALSAGEECQLTLRNYRADGSSFWNEVLLSPVRNGDGDVVEYIGIQNDVTDRYEAEARVEYLAFHDHLTGLANRHALQTALNAVARAGQGRDDGLALLFIDLDEFKRVNDSLGHTAGDELLQQVGQRLAGIVRPEDLLARQGGDEFLVMLNRLGGDATAVAGSIAGRIIEALHRPFLIEDAQVEISASVGVSLLPRDAGDGETLMQHADSAMYEAKATGGDGWALYGSREGSVAPKGADEVRRSRTKTVRDSRLAEVLESGDLRAVYQPLIELASGDVVGYEALIRGPAGSPLESPAELFSAARASGQLGELDWACRVAAVRGALDGRLPSPLKLFINAEPEVLDVPCPKRHADIWSRAGELDLVIEMTERALTSRPADLLHSLLDFRDKGWSIALDDVGADSRSLALMELLAPEIVKLDLRLVQARPNPEIAEIVTAVNAYAERTGAVVLAEGIETAEHLATARSIGASHGQGWLFGRPGALPEPLTLPARALPLATAATTAAGATPFEAVGQILPVRQATKPLLIEMSWLLERQALALGETAVLLSVFQTAERFTPGTRRRYSELAEHLAFVAGLGVGLEVDPAPGVRGATLADDDALKNEWSVVVLAPHFAGALVAMDLGDQGPDHLRRFRLCGHLRPHPGDDCRPPAHGARQAGCVNRRK